MFRCSEIQEHLTLGAYLLENHYIMLPLYEAQVHTQSLKKIRSPVYGDAGRSSRFYEFISDLFSLMMNHNYTGTNKMLC